MRGLWSAAAVLAGCYSPSAREGAPCTSSDQCPAGQVCNPNLRCEKVPFDAGTDAPVPIDAPIDAAIDGCASCPTLIARYAFDGDLDDETGAHPAAAIGSGLTFVPGEMGQAVKLAATGTAHVRVADAPGFDLAAGKIELRFRFDAAAPAGDLGLVSRDANGSVTDGHMNVRLGHDRRVVVRIQQASDPTVQAHRCTADPVAPDAWHRVEVSFGPAGLAMTVDGAPAGGASWTSAGGTVHSCTEPWDRGIAGNDNPLVFGALTVTSVDGTGAPVSNVASSIELDEIAVWAVP